MFFVFYTLPLDLHVCKQLLSKFKNREFCSWQHITGQQEQYSMLWVKGWGSGRCQERLRMRKRSAEEKRSIHQSHPAVLHFGVIPKCLSAMQHPILCARVIYLGKSLYRSMGISWEQNNSALRWWKFLVGIWSFERYHGKRFSETRKNLSRNMPRLKTPGLIYFLVNKIFNNTSKFYLSLEY